MVSLSRSINTNSGGATFFSESVNMEDREYLQPILESYGVFKPLETVPLVGLHLVLSLCINIFAIVYAVKHPDQQSRCNEYFSIIYLHIGLWCLTLVLDRFLACRHHGIRINGYLEFFNKTQLHAKLPFYIVSLWSVVIMLVQTIMQHFYPDDFAERCLKGGVLSPISYICALITFETCLLFGIHLSYISKVRSFNAMKPVPDVQREEWNACANPENFEQNEVGYRQLGDKVYEFLEKQADLISHLKEHNARLGEKLMVISAQLQHARSERRE